MEEFLGSMDEALRAAPTDPLGSLLTRWERRYPGKTTDTMITWNNIVEDRRLMVQRLEEALPVSGAVQMVAEFVSTNALGSSTDRNDCISIVVFEKAGGDGFEPSDPQFLADVGCFPRSRQLLCRQQLY